MKVLIVEDEENIRQALRREFEKEKITVIEATHGQEGLARAAQERPDCILLDVIMPRMHGIDMLLQLQATEAGKNIPVVLLTNYADDPKVVQAVRNGLCELLVKSRVSLPGVVKKVRDVVNSRHG